MENTHVGTSPAILLTLLFVGLKLTNYTDWSWWWVLSPSRYSSVAGYDANQWRFDSMMSVIEKAYLCRNGLTDSNATELKHHVDTLFDRFRVTKGAA